MNFKPVVLGLLAAACVTAAAGGAYLAVRQNAAGTTAVATPNPSATGTPAAQPVTETEALVTPAGAHKACFGRSARSRACSRTEHEAGARPPGSSPDARASSAGRECGSPTGGPGEAERQREGTGFRFSYTGRRPADSPGYIGSADCPGERPSSGGGRTDDRGSACAP